MRLKSIFKAIPLMLLYLAFFSFRAHATKDTVMVVDFQFQPKNFNMVLGDTILFIRGADNADHTTTAYPDSIPVGATAWDSKINSEITIFQYVPTVIGSYKYKCKPHEAFGMKGQFTVSAVLPVKLSEFKVSNVSNSAVLKWTTQSEDNTDYFSIQKSTTGADFSEIARVPASGHSSETKNYSYTDPNPSSSNKFFYYTIGIVDKDGKKQMSPVELFKNNITISKLILSLSPNPVSSAGHLMLKFNADKTSKMNVKVVNIEGKTVMETTMQAYEGVNNGHLMLDNIATGTYSVSFELNGVKEVYKIIVQ